MLTYVINLDRDTSRLAHMEAEAQRIGLEFRRFPAFEGQQISDDLRGQFFNADGTLHEPRLSAGEVGCYASHLAVLKLLASDPDHPFALVLEDDVRLADDLPQTARAAARCAPQWDIIRLSNRTKSVALPVAPLPNNRELVRYWTVPNSAGAYLISRAGAVKFLQAHEQRRLPIDEELRRPWRSGLSTFGILPPPVEPDVSPSSSISSTGRPRGVAARYRFEDASPVRDIVPAWNYRMQAFGPHAFSRALAREPVAATVGRLFGWDAAQPFCRIGISPSRT